ncbi:MAG TPA: sigma-54 dependent transcriptional regulator, partial [Polyangia bacterium]|nr:sigma-54 dependent transcriptional regulator [Polyangia bacterium]
MNSTNLPSSSGTQLAPFTNALDVLLVDDEPDIELLAGEALRDAGHHVTAVKDGAEALELVRARAFDLMICDIRLPKLDGLSLFRQTRQQSPDTTVILMTAFAAVQDAVAAVKEGAHDYLTKPFEIDEITLRVKRIAEHRALLRELELARAELAKDGIAEVIVGRSVQMLRLLDRVNTIAPSHAPVLLQGESGTGKELVARALHERGARRGKPFVAVNCAAFPETLLEAELFGHERGAFTGAVKKRDGRFRAAHGGTLLLDEVAEMSMPAQAKLLRVLQEGVIEPLGTNESVRVDVRVISATNRNLKERVTEGQFREDLYYRLNVLNVDIPPLRERKGDLPLLVQYFLKKLGKPGAPSARLSQAAWTALSQFAFPGNVRQLEHAIQHAVVLAGEATDIDIQHLPRDIAHAGDVVLAGSPLPRPLGAALKEFER